MPQENAIGLTELIEQVKRDLLAPEAGTESSIPLFSVDEVTLEIPVTAHKDDTGGVNIYVVEPGGGVARDDVQKVKVKLTPLLSKEERIKLYTDQHPALWETIKSAIPKGTLKGGPLKGILKGGPPKGTLEEGPPI